LFSSFHCTSYCFLDNSHRSRLHTTSVPNLVLQLRWKHLLTLSPNLISGSKMATSFLSQGLLRSRCIGGSSSGILKSFGICSPFLSLSISLRSKGFPLSSSTTPRLISPSYCERYTTDCEYPLLHLVKCDGEPPSVCRYFYKPYANDWQAIEAVLRLSSKYFIEHLRHRCLSRLAVDWPLTLDKWEARERDAVDDKGKYSPRELAPHPVLVISLAREIENLAFVLPSAFYDLSRYGPKKIVSGAMGPLPLTFDSPASSPTSSPTLSMPDSPTLGDSKDPVYLSHQDAINVLAGREQGQRFMISFIEKSLVDPPISLRCLNQEFQSQACRAAFYFIMLNALRSINGISFGRDADPLFTLNQTEGMLDRIDYADAADPKVLCSLNICAACKADFRTVIRTARQDVWKLIPSWFGLPGYGELKKHMEDR